MVEEFANCGYILVAAIKHSYVSISQPWHEALHKCGNISSKMSLVNQLEMPSPGSISQAGAVSVQS
jgi:hypothetical protein